MQQDFDSSWRLRWCFSSASEVELRSQGQNTGNILVKTILFENCLKKQGNEKGDSVYYC